MTFIMLFIEFLKVISYIPGEIGDIIAGIL